MMFAHALEKQMRYNEKRGKGDEWKECNPHWLFKRLTDEWKELFDVFQYSVKPDEKELRHESLDVSTVGFFLWYTSLMRTAEGIAPKDGEDR